MSVPGSPRDERRREHARMATYRQHARLRGRASHARGAASRAAYMYPMHQAGPTSLWKEPSMSDSRPPFPPFSLETAAQKARMAEDAWNTRDPERVALAYTEDSRCRNRP